MHQPEARRSALLDYHSTQPGAADRRSRPSPKLSILGSASGQTPGLPPGHSKKNQKSRSRRSSSIAQTERPALVLVGLKQDESEVSTDIDLLMHLSQALTDVSATRAVQIGLVEELAAKYYAAGQLSQVKIVNEGTHKVNGGTVIAFGDAQVLAEGAGSILAFQEARVTVRGSFELFAADSVVAKCYDEVRVHVHGCVRVTSYDRVVGIARDSASGAAYGQSSWTVTDDTFFTAHESASIESSGNARVRSFDNCRLRASGKSKVHCDGRSMGWFDGDVELSALGDSISALASSVKIIKVGPAASVRRHLPGDSFDSRFRANRRWERTVLLETSEAPGSSDFELASI